MVTADIVNDISNCGGGSCSDISSGSCSGISSGGSNDTRESVCVRVSVPMVTLFPIIVGLPSLPVTCTTTRS